MSLREIRSQIQLIPMAKVLAISGVVALAIFAIVFLAALIPELAARVLPFFGLPAIVFFGLMSRSNRAISDKQKKVWLIALVSILILWPLYFQYKFGGLPTFDPRKFISVGGVIATIYLGLSRKELSTRWSGLSNQAKSVAYSILLFFFWRLASSLYSPAVGASLLQTVWEAVNYYSMFFVALLFFGEIKYQEIFRVTLVSVGLLETAYVLVEKVTNSNALINFAPRIDENAMFFAISAISRWRDGIFRAQGTFTHPLLLSEFGAYLSCLAGSMLFFSDKPRGRMIGVVGIVAGSTCVVASGSRSGFIAEAAGLAVICFAWFSTKINTRKLSTKRFAFMAMILGAFAISIPSVMLISEGKTVSERSSSAARQLQMARALPSIEESPFLGEGPGTGPSIAGVRGNNNVLSLDSYLLLIVIESGVPALLLFAYIYLAPPWIAINSAIGRSDANIVTLYGCSGALVCLFVFRVILTTTDNMSMAFLTLGILVSCFPGNKPR